MALYLGKDLVSAFSGSGVLIKNQDITIKENGTYTAENGYTGLGTVTVDVPTGGGASVSLKDVNFYDYDGTILHSYTVEEAQALTELPELPTQKGLICQGWNYDLETIKAHNRALNIGATYITDDGKTRLYIKIAAEGRMDVPLYFSQTVANGVTIDWGDGSATETLSGTGNVNTSHTYASIGDYVISLGIAEGCTLGFGHGSYSYCVMGSSSTKVYCNMLQKLEGGDGLTSIGDYAFFGCQSLASITITNSVTSIASNAFNGCLSLASITIPTSVTSIGNNAFNGCFSFASITIPTTVTSIGNSAFNGCQSFASITIPTSVTSVANDAFNYCQSLASITIPTTVTSIGNSAFNYCQSLASITIPTTVTSIGDSAFNYCQSLASITITNSVTSIGNNAFRYCYGMKFYDFTSHTSVPTLGGTNAFAGIPSDCQIRVPASLYDEWIAATNWSTYASQIVAV